MMVSINIDVNDQRVAFGEYSPNNALIVAEITDE